jgi:hypothetical protein
LAGLEPSNHLVAQVRSNQKGELPPDLASASDLSSNTSGRVGTATTAQGKSIISRFQSLAVGDEARNQAEQIGKALGLNC